MSEAGRKALLVVNPMSGRAKNAVSGREASRRAKEAKAYVDALEATGMTLIRRDVQRPRLAELIMSMRNEVDCVVLAGGDGTLSAGAIALRDTGLPLGILPIGSDNDFAQTLSIPLDPAGAAAVIGAGQVRAVNLGSVNGRPFFTVASVGLTVNGARRLNRATTRSMGQLRFAGTAFRMLMQQRRFSAIIRCGFVVHRVRTVQITIGNGRLYSGGMLPGGPGETDETILSIYSLEPPRRWGLMFMSKLFGGEMDIETVDEVRTDHGTVVEVVTRLPQHVCADGEMVTVTPARFSVLPRAVNVYAPARPGDTSGPDVDPT